MGIAFAKSPHGDYPPRATLQIPLKRTRTNRLRRFFCT